jgi:hypothetical protein
MATIAAGDLPRKAGVMNSAHDGFALPSTQKQLLLHGKGQAYQVHTDGEVPRLAFGELLVEIHAIGLNPIDWKSA